MTEGVVLKVQTQAPTGQKLSKVDQAGKTSPPNPLQVAPSTLLLFGVRPSCVAADKSCRKARQLQVGDGGPAAQQHLLAVQAVFGKPKKKEQGKVTQCISEKPRKQSETQKKDAVTFPNTNPSFKL